jgi:hypothetical protein
LKNKLFITLLICCIYNARAQNAYWKEVTNLMQNGKFGDALTHSEQVNYRNKSYEAILLNGVSNYPTGKYESSLYFLQKSVSPGFITVKEKYPGLCIYTPGFKDEASADYNLYLSIIDPENRGFTCFKNVIYRCEENIVFKSNENFGCTENAGNEFNSPNDEIWSIQFPDFLNKFYYSSNKQGFAGWPHNKFGDRNEKYSVHCFDRYVVESEKNSWQPEFNFSEEQNTSKNKILYAFNPIVSKFIMNCNFYA